MNGIVPLTACETESSVGSLSQASFVRPNIFGHSEQLPV